MQKKELHSFFLFIDFLVIISVSPWIDPGS